MSGWTINRYNVRLELSEPMLGTTPCNPSIWAEHIGTKQAMALKKEGLSEKGLLARICGSDPPQLGVSGCFSRGFARSRRVGFSMVR